MRSDLSRHKMNDKYNIDESKDINNELCKMLE